MDINNLSGADAQEIASDEQNEYYSALRDESHQNHAFVKSRVEAAFAKKNPGLDESIRNDQFISRVADRQTSEMLEQARREPRNEQPTAARSLVESEQASAEPSPIDRKVSEILGEKWGDGYAESSQRAGNVLRSVFPSVEAMVEFGRAHGIDRDPQKQAEILDLLAKLGR